MDAEDRVSSRRKAAASALRDLAHRDRETAFMQYRSFYRAHGRLAIARANQKTLTAQKRLAEKRIAEAQLRLQAAYEDAEAVETQLSRAKQSLGAILAEMGAFGWMMTGMSATGSRPRPKESWSSDGESEGVSADMDCEVGSGDEVEDYGD
jgi:hypothetical protein